METIARLPGPREGLPEQYRKCKNKIDDVRRRNLTIFGRVANLKEQLTRDPKPFPKLLIKRKVENIEDFTIDDFEVQGYDPHPKITMEMAV